MEAMVLAAGKGTRLGELTATTPKCLMEVGGITMLERVITQLISAGVGRIVINLFHLAEQVQSFVESKNCFDHDIVFSAEAELFNTGGGVKNAESLFSKEDPIVIYNADIVCDLDIEALCSEHQKSSALATLVTRTPEEDRVLAFTPEGELVGWRNLGTGEERLTRETQPLENRGFCGIQCVSPVIFDYLERPNEKESIISAYLRAASAGERITEYRIDGSDWFDIGTPSELKRLRDLIEQKGS